MFNDVVLAYMYRPAFAYRQYLCHIRISVPDQLQYYVHDDAMVSTGLYSCLSLHFTSEFRRITLTILQEI